MHGIYTVRTWAALTSFTFQLFEVHWVILKQQNKTRIMTVLAVFSYGLIAFGPTVALFLATVIKNAHEVIILMSS